jgi:hypothetical protein
VVHTLHDTHRVERVKVSHHNRSRSQDLTCKMFVSKLATLREDPAEIQKSHTIRLAIAMENALSVDESLPKTLTVDLKRPPNLDPSFLPTSAEVAKYLGVKISADAGIKNVSNIEVMPCDSGACTRLTVTF